MRNTGFTLVEILIVVIILGILAAIVIPQFTEASNDARESALRSDLQTLRGQLELYNIQHLDEYPDAGNVVLNMTTKTDADHSAGTTYGPYLQTFPSNPFVSGATASEVTEGIIDPVPATVTTGWYFNTATGKMSPGDAAHSAL